MNEEDRIKLWLALYEEGEVMDGECYTSDSRLMRLLERFGVPHKETEREILMLLAWRIIEKSGSSTFSTTYRRKKTWKPSLGMLFLDKMDTRQLIGGKMSQGAEEEEGK